MKKPKKNTGRKKKEHDPAEIAKLTDLKNIGKARAVKLLEHFKSAEKVLNDCMKKDIMKVFPGKTGERIWKAIHFSRVGMKPKYSTELGKSIAEALKSGKETINEVCARHDISYTLFYEWKKINPEFRELVKSAEQDRKQRLKKMAFNGMEKLLEGYDYEEKKTITVPEKEGKAKITEVQFIKKHVTPNPTMIIFSLVNLTKVDDDPLQSVQHVKIESEGETEELDLTKLSDEELDQWDKLLKKVTVNDDD